MKNIIKRDCIENIIKYLGTDNCIVLHGARQVGKTHILYLLQERLQKDNQKTHFIDLEDTRKLDILNNGVESFILYLKNEGLLLNQKEKNFVFIDEIQYLSNPSSFLKLIVDHYKNIQLIVSGSSSFDIKTKFKDSLVGRTVNFEIFPLNFKEFLRFKNKEDYINNPINEYHIQELKNYYEEYVLYGGYPKIVLEDVLEKKEKYLQQIIDTYIKKDIKDITNIKDLQKFNNMLKILASQSGQILNISNLSRATNLAQKTIENHLFILENTYIIKLLRPFSTNADVEIVKAPKVFFYDTGILQMLFYKQLQKVILGNIFETSIFSELVKMFGKEDLYYWRNRNQNEIDFILQNKNKILPIETKISFDNFRNNSMYFFMKKYKLQDFQIVGLEGTKKNNNYIFPWEINLYV